MLPFIFDCAIDVVFASMNMHRTYLIYWDLGGFHWFMTTTNIWGGSGINYPSPGTSGLDIARNACLSGTGFIGIFACCPSNVPAAIFCKFLQCFSDSLTGNHSTTRALTDFDLRRVLISDSVCN